MPESNQITYMSIWLPLNTNEITTHYINASLPEYELANAFQGNNNFGLYKILLVKLQMK